MTSKYCFEKAFNCDKHEENFSERNFFPMKFRRKIDVFEENQNLPGRFAEISKIFK